MARRQAAAAAAALAWLLLLGGGHGTPILSADIAVDQLLGASFSAKFINCTVNSSAASWCDQSNPYAVAQPLVFNENGTSKNTTNGSAVVAAAAVDSGTDDSGSNRFQHMRDEYKRSFTCDGEAAQSLCRMVTQLTYIDGTAFAPRTVSQQPICSFINNTCDGMYWSDFAENTHCYASQSNCEQDCGGFWCQGDVNATVNVTGFVDDRVFAAAANKFDSGTGTIVKSADLYDEYLNSIVYADSGGLEIYFVLTLSDSTYGFQWLVYAVQPSTAYVRAAVARSLAGRLGACAWLSCSSLSAPCARAVFWRWLADKSHQAIFRVSSGSHGVRFALSCTRALLLLQWWCVPQCIRRGCKHGDEPHRRPGRVPYGSA